MNITSVLPTIVQCNIWFFHNTSCSALLKYFANQMQFSISRGKCELHIGFERTMLLHVFSVCGNGKSFFVYDIKYVNFICSLCDSIKTREIIYSCSLQSNIYSYTTLKKPLLEINQNINLGPLLAVVLLPSVSSGVTTIFFSTPVLSSDQRFP